MNRPGKSDQDLAKAIQLHQSGNLDRAIRLYEKVVRKQPRHAAALNLLGLARFQAGRLEDAVSPMERALAIKPDLPDARYNLGLILHSLRRYEDAIPHLQQSVAERPGDAEARNNLGAALKEAGRYEEAAEQYRAALALNAGYAEAHCNLGNALLALGRAAEAMEPFRRALELRPFFAEADIGLAQALTSSDRAKEALAHFERAIAQQSGNAEAYLGFGNALATLERHEDAIPQFRKAVELKPGHPDAHFKLGWTLHATGRYDEAAACFETALMLPPEQNAEVFTNRGRALLQMGRHEESIVEFDKAIEIDPAFGAAYRQKGETLLELGRFEEARRCFEQSIEIDPGKASAHYSLASITEFKPGDDQLKALEELAGEMTGLSEPQQVYLHLALGKAYSDLMKYERAIPHLIEAGRLKRGKLSYDENNELAHFDRARKVFTPELMREKRGAGDPAKVPLFIFGMPRAGKTFVEQMLGCHPKVFGAGERTDFPTLVHDLEDKAGTHFPELVPAMTGDALRTLGNAYVRRVSSNAPQAERIADELPENFLYAGLIHLALPNARFVHMMRDPVDQCMDCLSKLFTAGHAYSYDLGEVGRYHRAYQALMRHWRRVLPEGIMLEVQYEDMVDDFESQARRIVAHCGLQWDDACLGFHKTERPAITRNGRQVRQPLRRIAFGQWRAYREQLLPLFEALEASPDTA
jgi:tetratricopeptide (TPR) repeat protein